MILTRRKFVQRRLSRTTSNSVLVNRFDPNGETAPVHERRAGNRLTMRALKATFKYGTVPRNVSWLVVRTSGFFLSRRRPCNLNSPVLWRQFLVF